MLRFLQVSPMHTAWHGDHFTMLLYRWTWSYFNYIVVEDPHWIFAHNQQIKRLITSRQPVRINVSFCLEKALFVFPLLVFLKWTMPLSVNHAGGLNKVVRRVTFCSYSGCVLTKDLTKSTDFKNHQRPSVIHHALSLKKLCQYLISEANVWIIDAIVHALIYYSRVSQL